MNSDTGEWTESDSRTYRRTKRRLSLLLGLVCAAGVATPFVAQALGVSGKNVLIAVYLGTLLLAAVDLVRVPTTTSLEWVTRARSRYWIMWVYTLIGTALALLVWMFVLPQESLGSAWIVVAWSLIMAVGELGFQRRQRELADADE